MWPTGDGSTSALAAQAGLDMLKLGGNAVDALWPLLRHNGGGTHLQRAEEMPCGVAIGQAVWLELSGRSQV